MDHLTALIAQSVCKYSLRIPPRPRSLLLRSTQLDAGEKNAKTNSGKYAINHLLTYTKRRRKENIRSHGFRDY